MVVYANLCLYIIISDIYQLTKFKYSNLYKTEGKIKGKSLLMLLPLG